MPSHQLVERKTADKTEIVSLNAQSPWTSVSTLVWAVKRYAAQNDFTGDSVFTDCKGEQVLLFRLCKELYWTEYRSTRNLYDFLDCDVAEATLAMRVTTARIPRGAAVPNFSGLTQQGLNQWAQNIARKILCSSL